MTVARTEMAFGDKHRGFQLGQNFGQVHIAPERPETPPQRSSNVPFRRDPHFVERPTLTEQIRMKLCVPAGRVALAGLGGVGKSQLAIEYARRLRQESPQTWVLWLHASNAARFEQSVRDVADQLKLYGRKDPKADLLSLLRIFLRDESKGRWLVMLDNADDAGFLLEPPARPDRAPVAPRRVDYIPTSDHGSVMVTTRSTKEALRLVYESETVEVLPMSVAEAGLLLEKKLGQAGKDNERLVQALGCMPLAITQAAAYIRERAPRCSVEDYCEALERSRVSRTSLLRREVPVPNRDAETNNSVLITWQTSFEHIYAARRSAAELLSLMSCCDRLAIPKRLVRATEGATVEADDGASGFEDDIVALRSFSFISPTADAQAWEMHRLVQDATQVWLEGQNRIQEVRNRFVHCLYVTVPTGNTECRTLFPHMKGAMEQRPTGRSALLEWATVMYRAAWYAMDQGGLVDAMSMALCAITARLEQLGDEHEDTLASEGLAGATLGIQGRWGDAEELQVKVKGTMVRILGPEHPSTLTSMANLAATYMNQGRWGDAKELQVKVMEARVRVLGVEHPSTLTSMANLAATYMNQGRWGDAEELQVKVMETSVRVLGAEHSVTLTSMNNLALTYMNQGRWGDAEELQVKVMGTMVRILGPEHSVTLTSMANLAATYMNQGRWGDAEEVQVKVMGTMVRILGPEHPVTLTSMANLAATYRTQGRWSEAEELQVEVMDTRVRILGPEHPVTLTSMANLASIYRNQERWGGAGKHLRMAVDGSRRTLGAHHPKTRALESTLAQLMRQRAESLGKLNEDQAVLHDRDVSEGEIQQTSGRKWCQKLGL
ncbi:hypothetical protein KC343_g2760 [Hortaea werneckii]|uniref:NB-ARC domain-containing protein n=1 Tax=Hortaea werneckii TaxID=91943 RepID=A0A3M7DJA3_HORWE|nr:hypothetical protein KC352_g9192 [Hortaea werneckii]KAI7315250.1 hypothetical protein KC340_g9057 [Hortaea werneckii]KAI7568900.1 hypothetical protein KC317_g3780 [Hortaea werneckii]KAI7622136.1 hypothetical protein KC346_g3350 [Hortaea werneckii]KAI7633733.1 hypothetical protein KC343_g2760 [Hortaea werneckii]